MMANLNDVPTAYLHTYGSKAVPRTALDFVRQLKRCFNGYPLVWTVLTWKLGQPGLFDPNFGFFQLKALEILQFSGRVRSGIGVLTIFGSGRVNIVIFFSTFFKSGQIWKILLNFFQVGLKLGLKSSSFFGSTYQQDQKFGSTQDSSWKTRQ